MAAESEEIARFREFLRIKTVQPKPDYAAAVVFLKRMAEEVVGLPVREWEGVDGKTVVVMTWEGEDPSLPSVLLNSHVDVVPVYEDKWIHPPFDAVRTEEGKIYGRGTQDMKCVSMQYIEAIRRLKAQGLRPHRTVHLSFVPDEEVGGADGMKLLVDDPWFKALNVGFALDEGLANPTDAFTVFYGERVPWWVRVTCTGNPGHGSRFIQNTAMEKLMNVIQRFLGFRSTEEQRLLSDPSLRLGDVTTVNLTMLKGGVQYNVVPMEAEAGFDIRIPPSVDLQEFKKQLDVWTAEEGISYEFLVVNWQNPITPLSDDNIWWVAFNKVCQAEGLTVAPEIFPAATDSRFLRCAGIPAIGFSPINNTPILLHDHNEWLHEDVFMRGIQIYEKLILAVAAAK